MELLGITLSENTAKLYTDIVDDLIYPVKVMVMDPENYDDCTHPVSMDTGKKEFVIKVDKNLEQNLFENALIRDVIYCHQMSDQAPVLSAVSEADKDAYQVAMMISSVIMDIEVENVLKKNDMHIDDIDTMRLSDLFGFLKSGMNDYNRPLYNILTGLQITLLYFTTSKRDNIQQIIETFYLSDPDAMTQIDRFVEIIDKYGVEDNRSKMRCMRKMVAACDMKGRINMEYNGRITRLE